MLTTYHKVLLIGSLLLANINVMAMNTNSAGTSSSSGSNDTTSFASASAANTGSMTTVAAATSSTTESTKPDTKTSAQKDEKTSKSQTVSEFPDQIEYHPTGNFIVAYAVTLLGDQERAAIFADQAIIAESIRLTKVTKYLDDGRFEIEAIEQDVTGLVNNLKAFIAPSIVQRLKQKIAKFKLKYS